MTSALLHNYLLASRGKYCLQMPGKELPRVYADIFAGLVAEFGIFLQDKFEPPELVCVYSGTAHAETIALDDGRPVIVYDQYLGQILNRLSRLYLEQAPEPEVSAYLSKISAARCLVAGKPGSALRHAALFAGLADNLTTAGHKTDGRRGIYIHVGETFVLAHELVHFLYRSNGSAALLLEDFYLELISAMGLREPPKWGQLLSDERVTKTRMSLDRFNSRQRLLRERGDLPSGLSRAEIIKQFSKGLPKFMRRYGTITPYLLEECVCDGIAVLITVSRAMQEGIRIGDSVLGAFLALHNLRLLRWIDEIVALPGKGIKDSGGTFFKGIRGQTQLRFDLFRYIVDAWLCCLWHGFEPDAIFLGNGQPGGRNGAFGLIDAMTDLNEQYAEVIFDHATSSFWIRHEKTARIIDLDSVLRFNPGEDTYDVVRRVCNLPGWHAPQWRGPRTRAAD